MSSASSETHFFLVVLLLFYYPFDIQVKYIYKIKKQSLGI